MIADDRVADRVAEGYTLPASWYVREDVYEVERRAIFQRTWQYAGPADWVTSPGDYFTCMAAHVPILIGRDEEGRLRAHLNVCRHRGHIVADGRGSRRSFQCPYHAWTYGLDGGLRSAPRSDREASITHETLGLLPAAVDEWGPFVFVNPDPAAAPLADTLGSLPDKMAAGGLDVADVRFHHRREWPAAPVNWKLGIENDLECYHCPVAHPSFSNLIDVDPDQYQLEVNDTFLSQYGPLREAPKDGASPYDTNGELTRTQSHFLWPNVSINVNPGRPNVGMHLWRPDGHRSLAGMSDYYFAPDVTDDFVEQMIAFDMEVGSEDQALVQGVQRGLDSELLEEGKVLLESEQLVHQFQLMVARALRP